MLDLPPEEHSREVSQGYIRQDAGGCRGVEVREEGGGLKELGRRSGTGYSSRGENMGWERDGNIITI